MTSFLLRLICSQHQDHVIRPRRLNNAANGRASIAPTSVRTRKVGGGMKRRELLIALGGALGIAGCRRAAQPGRVADADIRGTARTLAGADIAPDQSAAVRDTLATMRFTSAIDGRVQPSLMFDPEVDGE
jgi:hypothetical protein